MDLKNTLDRPHVQTDYTVMRPILRVRSHSMFEFDLLCWRHFERLYGWQTGIA
jgi:hypothetical protein